MQNDGKMEDGGQDVLESGNGLGLMEQPSLAS